MIQKKYISIVDTSNDSGFIYERINGLTLDRSNSSSNTLELPQASTEEIYQWLMPLDVDLWPTERSDSVPQIALVWGWFGGTSNTMTTNQRSSSALAAIYETTWQSTDYNQITLCLRSYATWKIILLHPMPLLEIYGIQFPVWLLCRRPLLIRCVACDPITTRSPRIGCNFINACGVWMWSSMYNHRWTA